MKKAGEELRKIREEKGYSLLEVSKNTKISVSVLRALEEGRIDNIDPIYLKGFLKMYCRFLGLKWEDFLKEHPLPPPGKPRPFYQEIYPAEKGLGKHPHRQQAQNAQEEKKNKKIILISLSVIAALLFAVLALRGCVFILKKLSSISAARKTAVVQPKKPSPAVSKKPQVPAARQGLSRPSIQNPPAQAVSPVVKEVKPQDITLVIRAQENCYLTVKVDGRLVYQRLLPKARVESWTAKEKIELSVGNAAGVTLEVNGKILSSLGRRGEAIKNILITREGLKIM